MVKPTGSGAERAQAYRRIMEEVFENKYRKGALEIEFERDDLTKAARKLRLPVPKNLGDVVYSARYRGGLSESVRRRAPKGHDWIVRPAGTSKYKFVASKISSFVPAGNLAETKIPDATPGIIRKYALTDEQALLAILRYNRMIDIFTGVTCYSLQNHLRTRVRTLGQVETDEIYIGVDRRGIHFTFPIQAKGGKDKLNVVQIEQDFALCIEKFPDTVCRAIGAQFMADDLIALFEFEETEAGIGLSREKHYRLVPGDELTAEDLASYRERLE